MLSVDASPAVLPSAARLRPSVAEHLLFTVASALLLLLMYSSLRLALLWHNIELASAVSRSDLLEAFGNGLRFDLRLVVYAVAPLLLALLVPRAMLARRLQVAWLTAFASLTLLLGVAEMVFYREFHQRLNSLVFQYLQEDLATVASMLWHGFPVGRYLLAWLLATLALGMLLHWLEAITRRCPGTGVARCFSCACLWLYLPRVARSSRALRCAGVMPSPPTRCLPTIWGSMVC